MNRFKAYPKTESEELLKIRKAVDLHEYAQFKELVKLGNDNTIENEGDMLEMFLSEAAKEVPLLELHRELRDKLVGQLGVFMGMVAEWTAFKLNHKAILTFLKCLIEWYGQQVKGLQGDPAGDVTHLDRCNYLHSLALFLTTLEPYLKGIEDQRFYDYLCSLKAQNFSLFLKFLHLDLKSSIDFKAE